tara:strand:- start:77 stop:409 length:333 start_codon:yes stop_codon:yes gene_type:complete
LAWIQLFKRNPINSLQPSLYSEACSRFSFDWQEWSSFSQKLLLFTVATTFIAEAQLEAFRITKNEIYLDTSISVTQFVLKGLNRSYDGSGNFSFSNNWLTFASAKIITED